MRRFPTTLDIPLLPLLALAACSGTGDGPIVDPTPPMGVGPGATSDFVYYIAATNDGEGFKPFLAELDGTRRRALVSTLDGESLTLQNYDGMSVSPDGRHLAMQAVDGPDAGMHVVDVATGTVDHLPLRYDGINLRAFSAWSPDSDRFAYLWLPHEPENGLRLYYPDADQLITPELSLAHVTIPLVWSTDSSYFGVRTFQQGPFAIDLDVFDRDGNRRPQITPGNLSHRNPALALSAERVASTPDNVHATTGEVTNYVAQFNHAAGTWRALTFGSDEYSNVAYSPDGQWLNWIARDTTGGFTPGKLYMVDAVAGGPPIQLSGDMTPGDARPIVWSPASDRLAWANVPDATSTGATQLNVTDLTGATVSVPLPGYLSVQEIRWSPDGTWLACFSSTGAPVYVLEAGSSGPATALILGGSSTTPSAPQWTPNSEHLLWLDVSLGQYNIAAWTRGSSAIARLIGPNAAPPQSPNSNALRPTRDSTSVVWIKRDDQGALGIAVTKIDAPSDTRILSSDSGELDLTSVAAFELR